METKKEHCVLCGVYVDVDINYEEIYCCSGLSNECNCYGYPINPVFCEDCDTKIARGAKNE